MYDSSVVVGRRLGMPLLYTHRPTTAPSPHLHHGVHRPATDLVRPNPNNPDFSENIFRSKDYFHINTANPDRP
jgi:hypothetical protein